MSIEKIARRARHIARAHFDGGHTNMATWEDAVVQHLAITQALKEIPQVSVGEPSGSVVDGGS